MSGACRLCDAVRGVEAQDRAHVVWDDDPLVVVAHLSPGVFGHLLVVTRRHAPYVADLTDDEAAAVGRAVVVSARALLDELDPEYVFSAVIGTGVAHFHQHLTVRHRGTPPDLPWHEVDQWEGAPSAGRTTSPPSACGCAIASGRDASVRAPDRLCGVVACAAPMSTSRSRAVRRHESYPQML